MLHTPQKLHTFDFRHMFHSNFIHLSMKKSNLCTFATALLLTLPSYSSAALNLLESKSGNTPLKVNARHTTGGKNVIDNSLKKSPKGTADNDDDFEIVTFHPKGEYKSLGTGTYCEGLFSFYGAPEQLRWNVEIEESVEVPGWYRLQPYKDSNPITDLIGKCDDTYIYVNATDPGFVWCEDMILYDGQYLFSQLIPENEWIGYMEYGQFEDGVINMEDAWFCTYNYIMERWEHCEDGFFRIGLPGVKIPNYNLKAASEFHDSDNLHTVIFEKGEDVTDVYVATSRGLMEIDRETAEFIVQEGDLVPAGVNYIAVTDIAKNGRGLYTVCLVGMNESKEIVGSATTMVFVELDNEDEWEYLGRGYWQEGLISPHLQGATLVQLNVDIEKHKTIKDYYRLVNPLTEHELLSPYLVETTNHNHYIYINATDNDGVYLEPSEIGLHTPNGQSAVWSYAGMRIDQGFDLEVLKSYGYCGKLADGVITFPDNTLMYAETGYFEGNFVSSGDRFKVDLYHTVASAIETATDATDTPVEYFNLQGMHVDRPSQGIFLRRQGDKVTKEVIR